MTARVLLRAAKLAILIIPLVVSSASLTAQQGRRSGFPRSTHLHIVAMKPRHHQELSAAANGSIIEPGPSGAQLLYYGGPVASNVRVVVVFWGSNVDTTTTSGIVGFYQAVTNSVYFDIANEYTTNAETPVGGGASTNQVLGRGTVDAGYTITPSVCNTTPCTVFDDQIQNELVSQINAGHLPAVTTDSHGISNTLYMLYFPKGVTINDGTKDNPDPSGNSCVDFCGYHGTGDLGTPKELLYGVIPDFSAGTGCDRGCGSGTMFQDITMVSSHELLEAATDAGVGLAFTFAPPLAWYDQHNNDGEIGDICNQFQVLSDANAGGYSIQLVWSNVQNVCADGPPRYQLIAPATVAAGTPFTVQVAAQNTGGGSLPSFRGTVHFTSSDVAAVLPSDASNTSSFQVVLNTVGTQTLTADDTRASAMLGTASITVTASTAKKQRSQTVSQ